MGLCGVDWVYYWQGCGPKSIKKVDHLCFVLKEVLYIRKRSETLIGKCNCFWNNTFLKIFLRIEIRLWQIPKWKPFAKNKRRNIYRHSQIDLFFVNTNVTQSVRILSLTQSWVSWKLLVRWWCWFCRYMPNSVHKSILS